jgi:hypothetical protein
MGVDHGLGGRDNKKSREKREKRFKKKESKAKVLTAMPVKKREVVFSEESRNNYLTGFRQRKKERRQYGIAMQVCSVHECSYADCNRWCPLRCRLILFTGCRDSVALIMDEISQIYRF